VGVVWRQQQQQQQVSGSNEMQAGSSAERGRQGQAWSQLMHRLSGLMCASLNLAAQPAAAPQQHAPLSLDQDDDDKYVIAMVCTRHVLLTFY
jgi:hypothetical protein